MAPPIPTRFYQFTSRYLDALRRGDSDIELHFVSYFAPLLERRVRMRLRSPEQIQDATQETFARVFAVVRSRGGVRYPERFGAFVCALCTNVVREISRQQKSFFRLERWAVDALANRSVPALEASETSVMVKQTLARMPFFDRQLLQAVFLDHEDRPQLCRRFGITQAHLRVLVYRAKRRFMASIRASPGKESRRESSQASTAFAKHPRPLPLEERCSGGN
jgi:RNA polymerase sigma factor (sigma-70 family)